MTNMGIQLLNVQETIRHDLATERAARDEIMIKQGQLAVQQGQLAVQQGTLNESIRHDLVSEAQQDYTNRTGRMTAEANARNAEINAAKLSLDSYKYETTGKYLDRAKTLQATQSANKARQDAYTGMAQIAKIGVETKVLERQYNLEGTKVGTGIVSAVGTLIRGIGAAVK